MEVHLLKTIGREGRSTGNEKKVSKGRRTNALGANFFQTFELVLSNQPYNKQDH